MHQTPIVATLALTVLMIVCVPAVAQTTEHETISLEADIGLDGWVELSEPVRLRVTIRSELLFSGSLELRHGRAEVTTAVEVPAGGEKTYVLLISPTMATRALTIELVQSSDDSTVASIRVEPKDPNGNLLVGTMGFLDDLDLPRDTTIASVPVVEVPVADGEGDLAPLDYLVVGGGVPVTESMLRWVADGGRLLVQPGASAEVVGTSSVADEMRPGVYRLGDGQVLEQSRSTPSTEEWASVLVPFREEHHLSDFWGSSEVQMIRAASSSAKAGIPYTGVLIGLVVYAVVVAPVNLIVLRRIRRRELAWITVPAISLAAVLVFVILGSIQNNTTDWGQATLISGSEGRSESLSLVAASTNSRDTQTLSTSDGSLIYPAATADAVGVDGRAATRKVVSGQQLELIFPAAGYGTAAVVGPAPPMPFVQLVDEGERPSIFVENLSPYVFEGYGVVVGLSVAVGPGSLGTGEESTFQADGSGFGSPAQAVAEQTRQWNDSRWWQIYEPLAAAAQQFVGDQYFFGFVEDLPLLLQVNGEERTIKGPGMVVVAMQGIDLGHASPQVVATSPDGTIQGEGPWRWFSGEWALMRFTVPLDREVNLQHDADMFGPAPSVFEGWDWTSGTFVAVETGEIDEQRFVDPDGQVLVRVNLGDNDFGREFPIGSISLVWDTATE